MPPTTTPKKPAAETVRTTVVLDREMWRRLRYRAVDAGTNLQAVMTAAFEHYLKNAPKEPKR